MAILLTALFESCNKAMAELEQYADEGIVFPLQEKVFLKASADEMKGADWTVFTSPGAVRYFADFCCTTELKKVAAVGESTANVLRQHGMPCDLYPAKEYSRQGLIEALQALSHFDQLSFLIPCSALAPDEIPESLRKAGAMSVQRVDLYDLKRSLKRNLPVFDKVAFFSSSAVTTFVDFYGVDILKTKIVGALGTSTRKSLEEVGINECLSPKKNTIAAFMEVLAT